MTPAAPRRSPSQERSRETVAAVVEAAAQVFEAHGYAAATTNRIAQRAGVSIGTLYQYFADKDAVFRAAAEAHLTEVAARMAPLLARLEAEPPPDPEELLAAFFETMLELHAGRPRLHRFILDGGAPGFQESVDVFEEALAQQVAGYVARVRPDLPEPGLAARLLVQAVDALSHRWMARPGPESEAAFVGSAARLLAASLVR